MKRRSKEVEAMGVKGWFRREVEACRKDFQRTFLDIPPRKVAKNLLLVFSGNVLLSFGTVFFLLPARIVMGGNSGIALILLEIIDRSTGGNTPSYVDADFLILLLTIFFFVLAFLLLGFSSAVKNTLASITYPSFVYLFDALRSIPSFRAVRIEEYLSTFPEPVVPGGYDPATIALIAGIFGGIFLGLGASLAFKGGGSTGGTTCLVIFFSKHTVLKANTVSILIDTLIIAGGMFTYRNAVTGLIGILTALASAQVIAKVFVGGSQALHAEIVSTRHEAISHAIHAELHRGTTLYTARGGYSGKEVQVVYASFSKEEYHRFLEIVQREDPSAFLTITTIYDLSGGYGFARKELFHHPGRGDPDGPREEEGHGDL